MLRLATPLVLTELGWIAMGIVDTMAVGRVSAEALGAVSLGTTIFYTVAIFAGGLPRWATTPSHHLSLRGRATPANTTWRT